MRRLGPASRYRNTQRLTLCSGVILHAIRPPCTEPLWDDNGHLLIRGGGGRWGVGSDDEPLLLSLDTAEFVKHRQGLSDDLVYVIIFVGSQTPDEVNAVCIVC